MAEGAPSTNYEVREMVMITGKIARILIREYLNQPASHCDGLPAPKRNYAYGIGSIDLEFPADWENVPEEDCYVEVNPAEHIA